MAKPGRRVSTPLEFRIAFAKRVKAAREKVELSQVEMASELTRRIGRPIVPDTYRKWENDSIDGDGSLMPHDLITTFCDITCVHPFELLSPVPFKTQAAPVERRKRANG